MNKALALFAVLLLAGAPLRAQEFFGITSDDAQAMIGQAMAAQHLARLRALGYEGPGALSRAGKALGMILASESGQDCVLDAVIARMGARLPYDTVYPDVLRESETDESAYAAAVKSQDPKGAAPESFKTTSLPAFGVIYLADSASAYPDGAAMDAALAGEYARFVDGQTGVSDAARQAADAAAATAWYASAYPDGATSCRR